MQRQSGIARSTVAVSASVRQWCILIGRSDCLPAAVSLHNIYGHHLSFILHVVTVCSVCNKIV